MLITQLNLGEQKADLIFGASNGRSESSKDLLYNEAEQLISRLKEEREAAVGKTRGKIIHLLCLLGMVTDDGQPDYPRINSYVQAIGTNNPKRRKLFYLSPKEMNAVCSQVEAWYKRELKAAKA
jgi:hypothetical protein